ncbi:DUF2326 domain-containing protein [Clostridium chromiireducens]|uniref:DUF2326 domain-containing protein n=1 Tax=Clostridium chromiireducens TaxID=225345 RepID=A0A964RIM0_9CLOT|nr:DUF2326 domain-containing protein [Clostridium chromiireducens]MVX62390.1 DUF2326 domain-containing protein [Clostridium chromiireducens]
MILKNLKIYSIRDEKVIKEYEFNDYGLNLILGSKSEKGNGTGKSSMVQSISYLLGSKIPKDFQNRKKLNDLDIMLILTIKKEEEAIYLGRRISEKNKGFIKVGGEISFNLDNWNIYEDKEYKIEVEALFLKDESSESPSFASIREYIIRDEKEGFANITLLRRNATKGFEILSFLFGINFKAENEINKLKSEQDEKEKKLKLIESMSDDITEIRIKEKKIADEVKKLKDIATTVNVKENLELEKEEYTKVKLELNKTNERIIKLNNIVEQYQVTIDSLKENVDKIRELDDVEKFYNQMIGYFPDKIKRNKDEITNYYEFMVNSRGRYFNEKIVEMNGLLEELEKRKIQLEAKIEKRTLALKSTSIVEDINVILDKINEKNQELSDLRYKVEQYSMRETLVEEINNLKERIIKETYNYNELFKTFKKTIDSSEKEFSKIVKQTYDEDGILQFEFISGTNKRDSTGRIKIQCSIIDENSHGRSYMKINMFDICWLVERIKQEKDLVLLIHDGSYVKPDDKCAKYNLIKYIDNIMTSMKRGQYFITLNRDELNKNDIEKLIEENKVVAFLGKDNDEDRFMGMKYVD